MSGAHCRVKPSSPARRLCHTDPAPLYSKFTWAVLEPKLCVWIVLIFSSRVLIILIFTTHTETNKFTHRDTDTLALQSERAAITPRAMSTIIESKSNHNNHDGINKEALRHERDGSVKVDKAGVGVGNKFKADAFAFHPDAHGHGLVNADGEREGGEGAVAEDFVDFRTMGWFQAGLVSTAEVSRVIHTPAKPESDVAVMAGRHFGACSLRHHRSLPRRERSSLRSDDVTTGRDVHEALQGAREYDHNY